HFSRALDPTTTIMVHNEFRVANKTSGRSPWFAIERAEIPWLAHIDGLPDTLSPEMLRRSFILFLADFTHRPNPVANPLATGRSRWTPLERAGAEIFRDRCEHCHRAQLIADDPATRTPFERWEALVMAPEGALVWGSAAYARTGVTPYVHERGARVPSLRRLYK